MEKLLYSIGEVAEILGENVSLVRFWSDKFSSLIKPVRNAKGNRTYKPEDIRIFKSIYYLVKTKGMTLDGAASLLKANRVLVDKNAEIAERLSAIKKELLAVYDKLENEGI